MTVMTTTAQKLMAAQALLSLLTKDADADVS